MRGRDDTTGASLVPVASSDPGALPGIVPWTDPPAPLDPRYVEVCAGQRRRLVLSRRASGPGVSPAAARPADRTIAHACGMASVRMQASDLDGDGRLEIELLARGLDVDRPLYRHAIIDVESFWTELEVDRTLYDVVTRAPDGASFEIARHVVAADDRGQRISTTDVRTHADYEQATDSYIRGEEQTETHQEPRPWETRDPTEHPLLHAIRAALAADGHLAEQRAIGETRVPGSASASSAELALAVLDAAVPRAARAYQCVGYDDATQRIEALGTIRSASDVAALGEIDAEVGREMTRQCDCCGDCDASAAGNIECVAELALSPRDDADWAARFAECAAALEGVTAECSSIQPADAIWLWPLVLESARRAAAE